MGASDGRDGAGHPLRGAERHGALHPEVGPLQHLLPEGDLLARGVHPGGGLPAVLAHAEVEADPAEHLVVAEPVVVPDRHLQAAVGQLRQGDVLVAQGVLPLGVLRAPAHGRLLLGALGAIGEEVAVGGGRRRMGG